jgi:hypothetical protein
MSGDVASLAAEMTPYVSAAAAAYGGAVLAKVRDDTADATVSLGRRLLQRVFGTHDDGDGLPEPLQDVVADPIDVDALAALRLYVRKVMASDSALETEIREMLAAAGVMVTASGERSISAQVISGIANTGDNSTISK